MTVIVKAKPLKIVGGVPGWLEPAPNPQGWGGVPPPHAFDDQSDRSEDKPKAKTQDKEINSPVVATQITVTKEDAAPVTEIDDKKLK